MKIEFKTAPLFVQVFGWAGCEEARFVGTTTSSGELSVKGTIEKWTFTSCQLGFSMPKPGTFDIHWTAGTEGGIIISGLEFIGSPSSPRCVYEGSFNLTLKGGAPATMSMEGQPLKLKEASGVCRLEAGWMANWEVLSPNPLYVTK